MIPSSFGDLARFTAGTRTSTALRNQLATLAGEMSTGQHADRPRALGADLGRLAGLDRQLARSDAFAQSAQAAAQVLAATQASLDSVAVTRQTLTDRLLTLPLTATDAQVRQDSAAARGAFVDMVGKLNSRMGDMALFAGTATDSAALAPADQMLAALETAVAGSTTAGGVQAAVDAWFAPGGGFDSMGYLGDTGAAATRSIDTGESVTLDARADDPALRGLLKAAALAAMADAPGASLGNAARIDVLTAARTALLSGGDGLVELQASVGRQEGRVSAALARHAAQATAWGLNRSDLITADPYATATQLKAVEGQLDTHLTLTARLANLSLTRYLR